ncbi:hypothetical protein D3C76_1432690 [compost metagenome]
MYSLRRRFSEHGIKGIFVANLAMEFEVVVVITKDQTLFRCFRTILLQFSEQLGPAFSIVRTIFRHEVRTDHILSPNGFEVINLFLQIFAHRVQGNVAAESFEAQLI